jgi:hypothetical protein
MQIETTEINGFAIDTFNQHGLEQGKKQGICPVCSHTRKPANKKASVLLMTGNGVSVLVTIVIHHFNFILTSVRVKLKRYMLNLI